MTQRKKKSWSEKLQDSKDLPKVIEITNKNSKWGTGKCAIAAPIEIDEFMRQVPKGKLTTINDLRAAVAKKHEANFGCPITTGIFAWIAAHASEEQAAAGAKRVTPWWRTLKLKGELNPKYPGGIDNQRTRLEAEGHQIEQRGKRFLVKDYERALAKFSN